MPLVSHMLTRGATVLCLLRTRREGKVGASSGSGQASLTVGQGANGAIRSEDQ